MTIQASGSVSRREISVSYKLNEMVKKNTCCASSHVIQQLKLTAF
jgi:hypothetical protein